MGNSWAERDRRLRATGSAPLSASMFGRGELIPSPRTPHESMLGAPAEGSRRACTNIFSLNTFRYKGLLNCAGEHRGELCWESTDFRAERPRPLLFLFLFFGAPPPPRGILAKSPAGRLSPDSLPREPILGSIKSGLLCRNGPPKKRPPKSKKKSRIISLEGISLPREPILDSVIAWPCSACSA